MSTESEGQPRSGLALAGTIGGYVALCILVGLVVGVVLDRLFNVSPLFLIAGVVLGFIVSFYLTYRVAMSAMGE